MKSKLLTTLAATAGLLIAGFTLSSRAGPSESMVQAKADSSKALVTAPASCHTPAKAETDHCAMGDKVCDHASKGASACGSHEMNCSTHDESAAVAMNCPMHAKMKGCGMGGCH